MPSTVQAMTNHLLAETIPREQADIAAYYATGARPPTTEQLISDDVIVARFAKAVADGVMQEDQVVALAVEAKRKQDLHIYRDDLPAPERIVDLHARLYLAGLEDLGEARAGAETAARSHIFADRDDPARFDKASEWAQDHISKAILSYEAEEYALERKYVVAFERAQHIRSHGRLPPVTLRRDMHPLVAKGLGVDPERPILDPAQINALISGHRSDGEKISGKHYAPTKFLPVDPNTGKKRMSQAIGSYDFCPTPDKSVSVAWAFAPPPEQTMIYNAHIDAARRAVAYIGREIGVARHGEDRSEIVPGHIGWLEFTHYTSRKTQFMVKDGEVVRVGNEEIPGDPNLHSHFLIPNAIFCDDGRIGSLHTSRIRGFIFEADAVYHATLAQNLRDSGFAADVDSKTGAAVMPAIPRDVCALYSKRTNIGEVIARKYAEARGENWDELSDDQKDRRMKVAVQNPDQRKSGEKDDMADVTSWKAQAKEVGWDYPASFQAYGPQAPEMTREQRLEVAYEASLDFIERKLEKSAVITRWDLRAAAGYGLVHSGSHDPIQDINAVTQMMRERGVRQYGEMTALTWGHETGERHVSVTTELHESQEKEFIALGKKAAADHSAELPRTLLDKTIRESGLDFSGKHGKAQLAMIYRVGTSGRFSGSIAAAGAGKSSSLKPLVSAWKQHGRTVFGASLAWRQADDLVDSGIDQRNVKAFDIFIQSAKDGRLKMDRNSVVAVDEFALLGTRQGLELLRLQDRHGFQVVWLGDPKQCQAQPLDAQVLTPFGFRRMGDLSVGSPVLTPSGSVVLVTAIQDLGKREVYRVTFADGRYTECCADHLWKIWTLPRPGAAPVDRNELEVVNIAGEKRTLDRSLGNALGLGGCGIQIRNLIRRNICELALLDDGHMRTRKKPRIIDGKAWGGPEATEYLLNDKQIDFLIRKSRITHAKGVGRRGGRSSPNTPFRWMVRPLGDIKAWLDAGLGRNLAIPVVDPFALESPPQDLPIPPYALGLLLGDGHFGHGIVHYTTADPELIGWLSLELPEYVAIEYETSDPDTRARQFRLRLRDRSAHVKGRVRTQPKEVFENCVRSGGRREVLLEHGGQSKTLSQWAAEHGVGRLKLWSRLGKLGWTPAQALELEPRPKNPHSNPYSPLSIALEQLGLRGTRSHNKFIPEVYKRGSIDQRLAIVRGILDTDGTVGEGGTHAVLSSTSIRMIRDVEDISRSLGAITTIHKRKLQGGGVVKGRKVGPRLQSYHLHISHPNIEEFFRLPRKREKTSPRTNDKRLLLTSVERVGSLPVRCIAIDDRDGLYVTDGYIVTHNSISAGNITDLARRTLGSEQIPHIETTIRQQSDREKEIVGLLREGKARQAIDMKLEDGTALMVPGGYNECVERVAKLYAERLKETGEAPSITVPTNFDAHQVSIRVRSERKKVELVGADVKTIDAEDPEGRRYAMRLSPGDRVRLFKSIGQGLRNGSVVDVVAVDGSGMRIRSKPSKQGEAGKERFVPWARLQTESGRISLAYGDALTIHSAQSMTQNEHIYAFPSGSQAVNGLAAYSAGTRHRHKAWLVTSDVAEMREVKAQRPINDTREVAIDDKWANVASNFAYQPEKDLALAMLERVETLRRGTVMQFPKMLHTAHMRQASGESPSFTQEKLGLRHLSDAAKAIRQVARHAPRMQGQTQDKHQPMRP